MKKYLGNLWVAIAMLAMCACGDKHPTVGHPLLKLSLEEQEVSIHDVFSKVEVIPLETNDACLLATLEQINHQRGQYGILNRLYGDYHYYLFDEEGRFLKQVGGIGQGPGEYREVYSASHDEETGSISLLSPFGFVYQYTAEGKFIDRRMLPQKANYNDFIDAGDCFVTSSIPIDKEDKAISLIDKADRSYIKGYVNGNENLISPCNFYKYAGEVYVSCRTWRDVRLVNKDTIAVAYEWDFGEDNYSVTDFGISETEESRHDEVLEKVKDGIIPYLFYSKVETDRFYYAELSSSAAKNWENCHAFYHKADGSTHYFHRTTEGIALKPKYWGDTFMISVAENDEDLEPYLKILPQAELDKLKGRKEDENPVLVKCYYK